MTNNKMKPVYKTIKVDGRKSIKIILEGMDIDMLESIDFATAINPFVKMDKLGNLYINREYAKLSSINKIESIIKEHYSLINGSRIFSLNKNEIIDFNFNSRYDIFRIKDSTSYVIRKSNRFYLLKKDNNNNNICISSISFNMNDVKGNLLKVNNTSKRYSSHKSLVKALASF